MLLAIEKKDKATQLHVEPLEPTCLPGTKAKITQIRTADPGLHVFSAWSPKDSQPQVLAQGRSISFVQVVVCKGINSQLS